MERTAPGEDDWHAQLIALTRRLAPRLPEVDPGDLMLIIECLVRGPAGGRAFFLRQVKPGAYAP